MQVWDDNLWLQNVRLQKATSMELRAELSPDLRCKNTRLRAALTVEKRVAIALWKLANPDSHRSVANQFGVGRLTVGAVVTQVCKAINHILLRKTMTLGNVCDILDGFAEMGFPNCGGVHIPIVGPTHLGIEYINRKGYFSTVLQALLDHCRCFTDINAGWSRKVHDTRIFRNTVLYRKLQVRTFFPDQRITVGEVEMPILILGDPAYPLMLWLMKPYTGNLDVSNEHFNRLSRCRMAVECAFGHLKAHWRCFQSTVQTSEENIPMVIAARCTLHNICEGKGKRFTHTWSVEAEHQAAKFQQPDTRAIRGAQRVAVRIWDALRETFENEKSLNFAAVLGKGSVNSMCCATWRFCL
ncbi:uncharacterized protein RBU57_008105 [Macrochelys suwanniensis]